MHFVAIYCVMGFIVATAARLLDTEMISNGFDFFMHMVYWPIIIIIGISHVWMKLLDYVREKFFA